MKVVGFRLGRSATIFAGRQIHFGDPLGLVDYQSMLVRLGKLIKESDITKLNTVVDVGANAGFFTLMINNFYPAAEVYALEPIKEVFGVLEKNIVGLKKVKAFNIAASDRNGFAPMFYDSSLSLASRFADSKPYGQTQKKITVKTTTMDSFCKLNHIRRVDLLKIDVETYEHKVLAGANATLAKTNYLLIEISVEGNTNYTFSELVGKLCSDKFNFQLVAFRNYLNSGEGKLPIGDFLFKNLNVS